MNRRNLEYIQQENPRAFYGRADDKVTAKKRLEAAGLPTPETLHVVARRDEIDGVLDQLIARGEGFAIKPGRGFGGSGVLVVRRSGDHYARPGGSVVDRETLKLHITSILAGMFSLDHIDDVALIEALVHETPELARVHGDAGVSDLRLIVHRGRVVMGMLRMACLSSGGTANLHQGGLGLGIDLTSGRTTHAIQHDHPITHHPDTQLPLHDLAVPAFERAVEIAAPLNDVFEMNYLGVDIVFDVERGPLVLEVNVRPGLAIQLANREGLRERLEEGAA